MNSKLKEVIERVSELSDADQEFIAAVIEEELYSEANWDELFEKSGPQLAKLAEEAVKDYLAGRTEPLDLDRFN